MKKLFLLIVSVLLILSCVSSKQLTPTSQSEVVNATGKTKDELYIRANTWMVEVFNNAKSVIQFSDKESGIVAGKYLMNVIITSTTTRNEVYSIIKIQVKDEGAKITITPETYQNNANVFAGGVSYPLEKLNADIEALMNNFSENIVETENTNW